MANPRTTEKVMTAPATACPLPSLRMAVTVAGDAALTDVDDNEVCSTGGAFRFDEETCTTNGAVIVTPPTVEVTSI